jgi:Fe-S cluster biogenesis protein NfuA
MSTTADKSFQDRIGQIDALVGQLEDCSDPATQQAARDMVRLLLDLHAAGIGRMLEFVVAGADHGRSVLTACAGDELVASLLLLHGLHPEGLEARVQKALDKVRPYLHSHGGDVQLLGIDDGVVRLHLEGSCHGCPSSRVTLQTTIEGAIYEAAPDVAAIEVEGLSEAPARSDLVQLDSALAT